MERKCVLLEYGVLLSKEHKEYGCYSMVYDKKHGYYDEGQCLYILESLQYAIDVAKEYVEKGKKNTYAIITNQGLLGIPDDYNEKDLLNGECISEIEGADYSEDKIIYHAVKNENNTIDITINEFVFNHFFHLNNDADKIHYYEAEAGIVIDNTPMALQEISLELENVFNLFGIDKNTDAQNPAIYDVNLEVVKTTPAPNDVCEGDFDHLIKITFSSLCGDLYTEDNTNDKMKELLSNLHLIHEIKKIEKEVK